ncbi:beta-galactosidase [Aestuariivirga sp.]|uniref:beta-galactosidase n=1 Tax=Aestuariivirga sp. TaxID=2650926 RepID=UPI0039E5C5DA
MSLGVCYYPEHWPEDWWVRDAARMREMGIEYVRIAEFAWSRYEPDRGKFDFGWLDRAMDVLAAAGLKIVLGTPTCTPPKWLVDAHPEMIPVDEQGRPRGFGSRRHYTFSSRAYWEESRRIVEVIAKRYGHHPGLVGWQTDNEYGCHDTILSWSETDLKAFRDWLRRNYQSPEQLNEAWGNTFWSMEVTDFEQVTLPVLAVTETNPAAKLDFWRFHSQQVAGFDAMQCEILRAHSPGRWITHNFMGFFNDFDHFAVGDNLDLASWDSYPIGFVERFPFSEAEKNRWALTSHPDIAAFHHDLYRAVGKGRFWVMEQQPGPVNWAPWNPVPKRGMVRLWTWEALAHGAEVVSYFRWRQATFAQEQMHAGLNLPGLHELSQGGREATTVGAELRKLGALPGTRQASVAIVYDYETSWITRIQPQGTDFRYYELVFRWYEAARRLGLDVDVVPPGADLKGYRLVLVPSLMHISPAAEAALAAAEGVVLMGPRTGSKTRHHGIPPGLPPGPLSGRVGARVLEVSSLRPGLADKVKGAVKGSVERWRERLDTTDGKAIATFANGDPALVIKGKLHYLAGWPDATLLASVIKHVSAAAKLKTVALPEHIRIRRRGDLTFIFNYGEGRYTAPPGLKPVLGSRSVAAQSLGVFKSTKA